MMSLRCWVVALVFRAAHGLLIQRVTSQSRRLRLRSTSFVDQQEEPQSEQLLAEPDTQAVVAANTALADACFLDGDNSNGSCVEFPPALTAAQRVVRAFTFYSRVLPVLAAYKVQQTKLDLGLARGGEGRGKLSQDEEEARQWAEIDEWGSTVVAETIKELKGFYVKTGQVISTRVDLFPEPYTSKLATLQDSLDPMPFQLVEAIVRQELLEGEPLSKLFSKFEKEPLGCASIAQVHKATLLDGRVVAVKLQRPNVVPTLLGDIGNLKAFAKTLRAQLPVDYYTVFCELGRALEYELDFLHEAQAAEKIWAAVTHTIGGQPAKPSLAVPRAVPGLVSRRVLVMDFIPGTPLSRLRSEMDKRGLSSDSPEAKLLGRKLLRSLTEAYGRMIFGTGFLHGDPHPGNIFVMPGGEISLIDCGQVKQISSAFRSQLAEAVLAVGAYLAAAPEGVREVTEERRRLIPDIANAVAAFGVTFTPDLRAKAREDFLKGQEKEKVEDKAQLEVEVEAAVSRAEQECAAAVALLLFGTPVVDLPGGFSHVELSNESPIKQVLAFPQDLVMLGRATVLIKGIASRLDIPWSLAEKWEPACKAALTAADGSRGGLQSGRVPVWAKVGGLAPGPFVPTSPSVSPPSNTDEKGSYSSEQQQQQKHSEQIQQGAGPGSRGAGMGRDSGVAGSRASFSQVRGSFRETRRLLKAWGAGKGKRVGLAVYEKLPLRIQAPLKRRALAAVAAAMEREEALAAATETEGGLT